MRISDWSSDVCSSDLYSSHLTGTSRLSLTNSSGKVGSSTTTSATLIETTSQSESTSRSATTTGTASFVNEVGGQVQGNVSLSAGGDVTYNNDGVVFGSTSLVSQGTDNATTSSNTTKVSTAIATPPALDVVTTSVEAKSTTVTTHKIGRAHV